ncbi:copper chaperone [Alkalihalobacillus xiaoxiensis]|uniref:Copper chaperone CopZ n=1 Tax=Shouchella xiaoxiensis TaxID=766895 RepID=A0ABS2SW54_9BACI|nr:copper chaperone CopZ [Shouchella xiaoxiensis]MBM7839762.1 copper chaperone [Shouchella xiaoxiensis]
METIELTVSGMSCGHCVSSIEGGVGGMNGVNSVIVKLDEGRVTVTFDREQVSEDQLKQAIDELGYDVHKAY